MTSFFGSRFSACYFRMGGILVGISVAGTEKDKEIMRRVGILEV